MGVKETDATFVVYIDESGDEGFVFPDDRRGSSEWFVISAVVVRRTIELETVKLVARVKDRLGKPARKPLHFRNLNHNQRVPYIDEISNQRMRVVSVMVHKPSLHSPERFQEQYRLYWYTTRQVLERVSWYCRDILTDRDTGDGSAYLYFSNRRRMSYDDLRDYLDRLRRDEDVRIDWNVIDRDQLSAIPHDQRMGLQVADAVASSFGTAINPDGYGYTEDRFVRMLEGVLYHYRGRRWGYGIKVFPPEAAEFVRGGDVEERYRWIEGICS